MIDLQIGDLIKWQRQRSEHTAIVVSISDVWFSKKEEKIECTLLIGETLKNCTMHSRRGQQRMLILGNGGNGWKDFTLLGSIN
jgi:hypothetical protein